MPDDPNQWPPNQPDAFGGEAMSDMTVPRQSRGGAVSGFRIRVDDGAEHTVSGRCFLGRAPEPQPAGSGGQIIPIADPLSSVSKTHAVLEVSDGRLRVSDLGSTNGTVVHSAAGERLVTSGTWCDLAADDRVMIGDRWFDVVGVPAGSAAPTPGPPTTAPVETIAPPITSVPSASSWNPAPSAAVSSAPPASGGRCTACAAPLEAGAFFCAECGTRVDASGAVPSELSGVVDAPSSTRGSRTMMLVAGAVVGAVAIAAVAWFALSGGSDGGGVAGGDGLPRIAQDPASIYSVDVEIKEFSFPQVTGSPSSVYVMSSDDSSIGGFARVAESQDVETLLTNLDGAGDVRWEADLDGSADQVALVGDRLVVATYDFDGAITLHRLDPDSGEELWSEELDDDQSWFVFDGKLYVNDDSSIEQLSVDDASSLGRIRVANASFSRSVLMRMGVFVSHEVEDGEVQVFGSDFAELTEVIDIGDATTVGYANGTVLAAEEDELIGYDSDGEELFSTSTSLDAVFSIQPLAGGRWILGNDEETAAVSIVDGEADEIWSEDGSVDSMLRGAGYEIAVLLDGGDYRLIDASTGDRVDSQSSDGFYRPVRDGYVYYDGDEVEAISLPSAEVVWSERERDGYVAILDNGYATVVYDEAEASLEVFG